MNVLIFNIVKDDYNATDTNKTNKNSILLVSLSLQIIII